MKMPLMDCIQSRVAWQSYWCLTPSDPLGPTPDPPTQPRLSLGQPHLLARAPRCLGKVRGRVVKVPLLFRDSIPFLRGRVRGIREVDYG